MNLGDVLNVVEDVDKKMAALHESWNLCQKILVVAARIVGGGWGRAEVEYGDGILTQIGTFQEFYTQAVLRDYWETIFGTNASSRSVSACDVKVQRCEEHGDASQSHATSGLASKQKEHDAYRK